MYIHTFIAIVNVDMPEDTCILDFLGSFIDGAKNLLGIYKSVLDAMNEDVTGEGRQGIYCSLPWLGSK